MSAKKVIMAMSGGVDSSVAALMLIEQGYDVIGMTMKNWEFEESGGNLSAESSCCSLGSIENARMVSAQLGIPHYVFDISDFFRENVIDNFTEEYLKGNTPNPCVRCNYLVRWDTLLEKADSFDAEFVSTGHYVRTRKNSQTGETELLKGVDSDKDQSYVLWGLSQNDLKKTIFPLGQLTKDKVREKAEAAGLRTAKIPESFEICFIPDNDYRRYIRENVEEFDTLVSEGEILDRDGSVLGIHKGYVNYTIGQRKGLGISLGEPVYVTEIDPKNNTIRVGDKDDLLSTEFSLKDVNFISEFEEARFPVTVKIRYHHEGEEAIISRNSDGTWNVIFEHPVEAVTPGQSAVFYDSDRLIGGGTIL